MYSSRQIRRAHAARLDTCPAATTAGYRVWQYFGSTIGLLTASGKGSEGAAGREQADERRRDREVNLCRKLNGTRDA